MFGNKLTTVLGKIASFIKDIEDGIDINNIHCEEKERQKAEIQTEITDIETETAAAKAMLDKFK